MGMAEAFAFGIVLFLTLPRPFIPLSGHLGGRNPQLDILQSYCRFGLYIVKSWSQIADVSCEGVFFFICLFVFIQN